MTLKQAWPTIGIKKGTVAACIEKAEDAAKLGYDATIRAGLTFLVSYVEPDT